MTELNPGDIIDVRGQLAVRNGRYLIVAVPDVSAWNGMGFFDVREILPSGRLDDKRMAYLQLDKVVVVKAKPTVTAAQMREGRRIKAALNGQPIPAPRRSTEPTTWRKAS